MYCDCSDSTKISPTVNGMRVFGINKGQIQRAVVKYNELPDKQPLTVCFHFPGAFLTHRYVLDMVRQQLKTVEGAHVKTLQFIDRNTIHGTRVKAYRNFCFTRSFVSTCRITQYSTI